MSFNSYATERWKLDEYDERCDQRAVQKKDFKNGTDYDGYTWSDDDDDSTLQETMVKYVMRRKTLKIKMFKKITGTSFTSLDTIKYRTTQPIIPPAAFMPFDKDTYSGYSLKFKKEFFVESINATFTKDQGCLIKAAFTKTYEWELIQVNKVT